MLKSGPDCPKALCINARELDFNIYRKSTYLGLEKLGLRVAVACDLDPQLASLRVPSFSYYNIEIKRGSINPISAFKSILQIRKVIRDEQPQIIISYSLKISLLSSFACIGLNLKRKISVFTGMGYIFTDHSPKALLLKNIFMILGRLSFKKHHLCALNKVDFDLIKSLKFSDKVFLLPGEGIDPTSYSPKPKDDTTIFTITYVGRMLKDKGLQELIEVGKVLKSKKLNFKIRLVGLPDFENPNSLNAEEWQNMSKLNFVEQTGYQSDLQNIWDSSDIAILLSYREGLPQSLLEAALCEKPIIASDIAGCREIIIHKKTGYLVNPKDIFAIAELIDTLHNNREEAKRIGKEARSFVLQKFNSTRVSQALFEICDLNNQGNEPM